MSNDLFHFLFMRHGESEANVKGLCSGGSCETPLTITGQKQVLDIATKAQQNGVHFSRIYASPALRAVQTAQLVHKTFSHIEEIEIEYEPRFKEREYGIFEGTDFKKAREALKMNPKNTNIESESSLIERVHTALLELAQSEKKKSSGSETSKPPLIISHGGVWQAIYDLCANKNAPWIENSDIYEIRMNLRDLKIEAKALMLNAALSE